jgi:signal transduction histidine kinase
MTSIRSFSAILMSDGTVDRAQFARFSSIINAESQRLTRILDDILDLSFLESGKVKLNLQHKNLGEMLEQSIIASRSSHSASKVNIRLPDKFSAITLLTDADRLTQVFINLISNAIKYNDKPKPIIKLDVQELPNGIAVTVSDNGPGIAEGEREIIFEKFSKLSSGGASSGVGLGLSICAEIMRNLGGDIRFKPSRSGATFEVFIPTKT